jgi:SAM-dependent methyltransferase
VKTLLLPESSDPTTMAKNMHTLWSREAEIFRRWYPQHAYRTKAVTEAIIAAANVRSGMHVLDIACGSGEPSLTIASVVGKAGRVTATDLTEEMLGVIRENAREKRIENIEFRQADAAALPFPDQSFDAVSCRYGVMYFSDVSRAMHEIHRVLKVEATAALTAWGPVDSNPHWKSTFGVLQRHFDLPPRKREVGNPFLFDEPSLLGDELRKAGFEGVSSKLISVPYPFPGPPELAWQNFFDTCNLMGMMDGLDSTKLEAARQDSLQELKRYSDGRELIMDAVVVLASGKRGN